MIEWAAFVLLAAIAVAGALGMLLTMSMYRAAIFLMASFVALAGLFVLLDADLLAAIQVMMNVGGMLVMLLFMVPLMMDPGGEMMWDMKRQMRLPGFAALSMSMPRAPAPEGELPHAGGPPKPTTQPTDWTCPMHPEVSSPGPGKCPKCGMDLVPRADLEGGAPGPEGAMPSAPESDAPAAEYTCPMHPEVRSPTPGKCPKCGMELVPSERESERAEQRETGNGEYTCPMHPEVRSDGPGRCPRCGMDLVPEDQADREKGQDQAQATAYTCPMHPEVQSDTPGTCPKCGMALVAAEQAGGTGGHKGMQHAEGRGMLRMSPAAHHKMMVDMAMSTELLPWAIGLGAAAALIVGVLLVRASWPLAPAGPTEDAVVMVGDLLLSRYMLAFEGAAFLILAGIVGAVILGKRERTR